jgi:exoribonuclease-2
MNVFYEEDGGFKVASVMSETGGALQVESASGKRSKIKANNVLLRFESALASFMDEVNAEAENLEVPFLWECCGEPEFGFEELAQEYYGQKPNATQSAAVAIRLHSAPVYFYRKGKGRYKAAPPETLKAALAAVEKKRLQAEKIQNWVEQLKAKQMSEELAARLDMLLYAPDKNSMEWKAVEQASNELHINPVQVISYAGGIQSNHDYHLGAFLREYFAKGTAFADGLDLATLPQDLPKAEAQAFSIDDSTTTEIDDAFSVQKLADGTHRIGIHIAAPALGIAPHSALDEVALSRLSTVYMPGNKITMLPEHAITPFSLDEGQWKPALSLYLDVAPDLTITARNSKVEFVYVADNLRHDSLEPYFNEDTLAENNGHPYWEKLSLLFNLAESLEKARGKHDPNRPIQIDYNFYVEDGKVRIVGRRRGSPMDKLVAELMIEANSQWGALLAEHQVSGIYRAQNGGRVYMTTQAEPHQGLGVAQYAWSTSPLRRAVDLVNQRQMIAVVQGREPTYASNDDELAMIMRHFDLTYSAYGDFQTRMERYWCLQYLVQENIQEVSATVWRENLVRLDHMPYITKVFNMPELATGTRVMLEIKRVDTLMMELDARFKSVEETSSQAAEVLVDETKGLEEVL